MLAEPPLLVPRLLRPLVRGAGHALAWRFARQYRENTNTTIGTEELRWHQAVVCLRALVEVAGWVHDGTVSERRDHPWLAVGPAAAAHLSWPRLQLSPAPALAV